MIAAALVLALAGLPLLEAEEPHVREGNEALLAGDAARALERYDAAERAVGPRAELDYDRGVALQRLGRPAEARDAYRRVLDRGAGALGSRALQNTGNALDALGDRDGAVTAFVEALRADPRNEDARYDLEVLLRRQAAGKGAPRDPGGEGQQRKQDAQPQAGRGSQAGKQEGTQQPPRPGDRGPERDAGEQEKRGAAQEAQRPDARDAGAQAAGPRREDGAEAGGRAAGRAAPLSRQDAEQLLDALRARERNMPLAGRDAGRGRRADAAKDW